MTIGADGDTKNREARHVDFNPALETHLREMLSRRAPDCSWLFPSPQRGERDAHCQNFRESLLLVRAAAGMPDFGFHDCRHHFISHAVMAGIDFMTIARWVGHKDGGVLIGRVYGHLADEHRKAQAARLNFGPTIVPSRRWRPPDKTQKGSTLRREWLAGWFSDGAAKNPRTAGDLLGGWAPNGRGQRKESLLACATWRSAVARPFGGCASCVECFDEPAPKRGCAAGGGDFV